MKRVVLYNLVAVFVLLASIELTTRVVSWISGNGFTLALHEVDPFDKRIKNIYKWHPFVGFTFNPSTRFRGSHPNQEDSVDIFVDQYGFLARDQGLALRKEADEVRIATIGGSTTASINLSYDQNWPGYLGNLVQKKFPGKKVRVINAGTPGFDTAQSVGNLALRVMPFKPDVVIIYHAYNDLKVIRASGEFSPDYSHIHNTPYGYHKEPGLLVRILSNSMLFVRSRNYLRKLDLGEQRVLGDEEDQKRLSSIPAAARVAFEEHVRSLVAIARAGGSAVVLSSFATLHDPYLDWNDPEKALGQQTDFQRNNIRVVHHFIPGLTVSGIFAGITQYNEVLHQIAVGEKVYWVDSARRVPHEDRYFVDGVHFSAAGASRLAEGLAPTVEQIINSR